MNTTGGAGETVPAPPTSSGYGNVRGLEMYYEHEAYRRMAPDPDARTALVVKVNELDRADLVRPEHTVEMFRLLGEACPATWPGSHEHSLPCSRAHPTSACSTGSTGCPR